MGHFKDRFYFVLWPFLILGAIFAHGAEVTVQDITADGRGVELPLGSMDEPSQLKVGDSAVLLSAETPDYGEVKAKLLCLRVFDLRSWWRVTEGKLTLGASFFLGKSALLRGHRSLTHHKKMFISHEPSLTALGLLKWQRKETYHPTMVKKKNYEQDEVLLKAGALNKEELIPVTIAGWQQGDRAQESGHTDYQEKRYPKTILQAPSSNAINEGLRESWFQGMVLNYREKLKNGEESAHPAQAAYTALNGPETLESGNGSTYEQLQYQKQLNLKRETEKLADELSHGEDWSKRHADDDLRRIIKTHSVYFEKQRQLESPRADFSHQVFVSSYFNIDEGQDSRGSPLTREMKISDEFWWGSPIKALEQWSTELGVRKGAGTYMVNGQKLSTSELTGEFHLYFYPFHTPNMLERNLVFVGLGARMGTADLTSLSNRQEAVYRLNGFPHFSLGMKYLFSNGAVFKFQGHYEQFSLTIRETSGTISSSSGNLAGTLERSSLKLSLGLGFFF